MSVSSSCRSRILYQSAACVAVNKLKGEAVEGAAKGMVNLQAELALVLPPETELIEAVHRLDVPVTGCALFALTKKALPLLNAAFSGEKGQSSQVEKVYWAVVEKPQFHFDSSGELVHWIETDSRKNKSFARDKDGPGRKKSSLYYTVKNEGKNYLFLEIRLFSGRHHQIRCQLAAAGLPVKGDLKYGAKRSEKNGGIRLHARSLSFLDPDKNEKITVTANPPQTDSLWEMFLPL